MYHYCLSIGIFSILAEQMLDLHLERLVIPSGVKAQSLLFEKDKGQVLIILTFINLQVKMFRYD